MFNKTMKFLALVIALTMMITGCSKPVEEADNTVNKTEDVAVTTTPEAEATPEADTTVEPVTINYMTFRTDDDVLMTSLIEKFQSENPGITVNRVSTKDTGVYYQTLKANIVSNTDVDVFDIHPNVDFATYANEGVLADLSALDFNATYADSAKSLTTINGKNYGYLNGVNMILCFYNKELFAEAGVQVPTNFTELVSVVNALKAKDLGGIAYCGADVAGVWLGNAVLNETMGAEAVTKLWNDIDAGTITSLKDNSAYASTLNTLAEYNKNGLLYNESASIKYPQALSLFASKKAAIMMMGTWTFGTADTDFPGIDYGIFPLPTLEKSDVAYAEPAHVTSALATSMNLEAATKFVNFLGTLENAQIYSSTAKTTPTVNGVKADFKGADMLSAVMEKGMTILPIQNIKNGDAWTSSFNQIFADVLFDGVTPDAAMTNLEEVLKAADLSNK